MAACSPESTASKPLDGESLCLALAATNKPFEDPWAFGITIQDGKLATIREYIDTQAHGRGPR
ncbi:hypothetical protein SAMN02787076_05754 [Rhizobacter sp. OV335]|jgi:ketosteroid isomerase-like protein|nr:hypothetical protein SAMN02787076_05754 [Rhizobacter sp. OV335]